MSDDVSGKRTSISRDPIGIDPIGSDPLDFSDAPPDQGPGPNKSFLGWTATATSFFIAAVVLGVIMVAVIAFFAGAF